MKKTESWTIEEADHIEKYFRVKSDEELGEDLNMKTSQIKKIRYELGFKKQRQTVNKESPEGMKWCWYCTEFHPIDEFSNNKRKKDGKQDECRKAVKFLVLKRKANKNRKPLKLKEKLCTACEKTYKIDKFIKNVSTNDGYSNLCIECLNKNEISRKYKNMGEK